MATDSATICSYKNETVNQKKFITPTNSVSLEGAMISVVIPAYNEGASIRNNLDECIGIMRKMGHPFELVVVNDGSVDDTLSEIEASADQYPEIRIISYADNRGKGNAIKTGSLEAKGELITFIDADLEIHPRHLPRFIRKMEETGADIVIGSKRLDGSLVENYPAKRRFLSQGYNLFVRCMFNISISDTQPGFKLFKRNALMHEVRKIVVKRYAFDLELLLNAQKDGYSIVEASIELRFTRDNGGRIGFKTTAGMFIDTLGIFYRMRIRHYYDNTAEAATTL